MTTRRCNICACIKEIEEFEKMPGKPFGRGYRCHQCNRERRPAKWTREVVTVCGFCKQEFSSVKLSKKYCSVECNDAMEPSRMANPRRFFQSLLNPKRMQDKLTADDLMELLQEQEGKCALTGKEMTFIRGEGPVDTNCSLDRLVAGGPYTKENIQLVCSAVNGFRRNLPLDTFIQWCAEVTEYKRKGGRN